VRPSPDADLITWLGCACRHLRALHQHTATPTRHPLSRWPSRPPVRCAPGLFSTGRRWMHGAPDMVPATGMPKRVRAIRGLLESLARLNARGVLPTHVMATASAPTRPGSAFAAVTLPQTCAGPGRRATRLGAPVTPARRTPILSALSVPATRSAVLGYSTVAVPAASPMTCAPAHLAFLGPIARRRASG
jgi:hypothetical protein